MGSVTLPGTGAKVFTDLVGDEQVQIVKLDIGGKGVSSPVTSANPIPVSLDGPTLAALEGVNATVSGTVAVSNFPATQAVSGAVSVSGSVAVSNFPATAGLTDAQLRASAVPVSAAALPLPIGAATEATLAAVQTLLATLNGTVGVHNAPFVDGAPGQVMLAKRRDSDGTTVADGDLNTLNMDEEGRLKVASKPASYAATVGNVTSATSTVVVNTERFSNLMIHCAGTFAGVNCTFEGSLNSTNGTDGNWFAVQAIRSSANTIETTTGVLAAAPAYAWELSVNALRYFRIRATAWTSGAQVWTLIPGTYATEPIPGAQVTATQPVSGTVAVNPVVPGTPYFLNSAATTNGALILAGTSNVSSFYATNEGATAAYIKLYNKATAPTVGTDVPEMTIPVPAAVSGVPGVATIPIGFHGFRFALGLGIAITRNAVHTDTTAIGAGEVKVKLSRTV